MSVHINRATHTQVKAQAIAPTMIVVAIGSDTTVGFDNVPDARRWVDALDRAIGQLEVQARGVAA